MTDTAQRIPLRRAREPVLQNPAVRGALFQILLAALIIAVIAGAIWNVLDAMSRRPIPTGFGFLGQQSGFDINQTLIPYDHFSTYGRAFFVGLVNTLLVGALGVVLATALGFTVGIGRLSSNWVVAKLSLCYVELFRNIPLLLQLLFWYHAVLNTLPAARQSYSFAGVAFLNTRGLFVPWPRFAPGAWLIGMAAVLGVVASITFAAWARGRQKRTGQQAPVGWVAAVAIVAPPAIAYFVAGRPIAFDIPALKGFNFGGGQQIFPEFLALLVGLTIYTAAFIAEIVRAGVQSVARGQSEAAQALGLAPGRTRSLVVVPQAMRVIIPPLTNQYLNLIKNSSLAVFIGYPDLVEVFAGTVLNQTSAALQCMAITMGVYLVISLATSFAMNTYNRRVALVER